MPCEPLPASAQAAYADLLVHLLRAPAPARGISYIRRTVKERVYWYLQYTIGADKRSRYIGPDNDETRRLVDEARRLEGSDEADRETRRRLVGTGVAAGLRTVAPAEARVYEALVQAGLFEAGAVVVGTHAFLHLGNVLCVRWEEAVSRTEDIDVAQDGPIDVASPGREIDVEKALRAADRGVFAVPALDRGHPSTRFRIRNRRLTVSLLTPERGKPSRAPVRIDGLRAAAQPVRFLDYLIENSQPAALPVGAGLLVRVPDPARFALHKLVVSQRRPAFMAAKSRKDLAQASSVLEALADLRPGDIELAATAALDIGGSFVTRLRTAARLLRNETGGMVLAALAK